MRKLPVILLFFVLQTLAAQPIELTVKGGIDGGTLGTSKVDGVPKNLDDMLSRAVPVWQTKIAGRFGKTFCFDFGLRQDPFWQSTNYGSIGLVFGIVQIGMGFQFGLPDFDMNEFLFASADSWDSGLTGFVKLEFPGAFFIESSFLANFKGDTDFIGNTDRQLLSFIGGIWLPHILVTSSYTTRDYSETKDGLRLRASHVKALGRAEFFAKKVPFRIAFEGGYVAQSLVVSTDDITWSNEIFVSYWYPSFDFTFILGNYLSWNIRADLPFDGLYPQFDKIMLQTGLVFTILGNK
jgi:hypothetical protein